MGANACSKPHVVAELVVASKNLIEERSKVYKGEKTNDKTQVELYERDANQLTEVCDFRVLKNADADLKHGENGLYCTRNHFHYDLHQADSNGMNVILSEDFEVGGAEG